METRKPGQCVIFCALPTPPAMRRYVRRGAYLIAADAGYLQAEQLGFAPDLILGDFDSSARPGGAGRWASGAEVLELPKEKDDTDAYFAVKEALRRGYRDILLLGAAGGRPDHTHANLQAMLHVARSGGRAMLAGETGEWYCMAPGELELLRSDSWVSVFAAGGEAKGVYLKGLKYPLVNATLTCDFPLGTSNEFIAEKAFISCESGYLYVMVTRKTGPTPIAYGYQASETVEIYTQLH